MRRSWVGALLVVGCSSVEVRLDARTEDSPSFSLVEVEAVLSSGDVLHYELPAKEDFFPLRFTVPLPEAQRGDPVSLLIRGLDQNETTFTALVTGKAGETLSGFIDFCGDGFAAPNAGEECDGGPNNSDFTPGACRLSCVLPACGDGVLDSGEECDDGNDIEGDGCDSTCLPTGCGSGVPTPDEICFAENDDLRGPPNPRQVAAADLTGDGLLDLVAPYPVDGVVRLYPGLGGGIFGVQADLPFPGVERLAVGDLNGDGALDLVGIAGSSASVLLNDGAGVFSVVQLPSTFGAELVGVELVDLDGNGTLDLLTLDRAQGAVAWRPGLGDGRFGGVEPFGQILAVGALPRAFAVADLDQDGDLDAVVVRSSGAGRVLLNDGAGQLAPEGAVLTVGGSPSAIVVGDFDSDGLPDIAAAKQENGGGLLRIFLNREENGFPSLADFDAPDSPSALVAADLDLDGDIDLAATGEIDSLVAVQFNNSAGQFDPPRDASGGLFETRRAPVSLLAKDLNGDGVPDLVAAGENLGLLLSNP